MIIPYIYFRPIIGNFLIKIFEKILRTLYSLDSESIAVG